MLLEHHANAGIGGCGNAAQHDVPAPQHGPAAVGWIEPGEHLQQGRLAGTVLADETDNLLRPDLDGDVVKRLDSRKCLVQMFSTEHQVRHFTTRSRLRRCHVDKRMAVRMMAP